MTIIITDVSSVRIDEDSKVYLGCLKIHQDLDHNSKRLIFKFDENKVAHFNQINPLDLRFKMEGSSRICKVYRDHDNSSIVYISTNLES